MAQSVTAVAKDGPRLLNICALTHPVVQRRCDDSRVRPSCISKGQVSGSASDTGVRGRMEGGGEDYGDVLDEDRAAALFEKPLEVLSRTLPLRPASTLGPSAATGRLVCMLGRRRVMHAMLCGRQKARLLM